MSTVSHSSDFKTPYPKGCCDHALDHRVDIASHSRQLFYLFVFNHFLGRLVLKTDLHISISSSVRGRASTHCDGQTRGSSPQAVAA